MSSTVVLLLGVVGLGGCNDRPTGPAATAQRLSAARAAGLPFTEGLASPEWQEIARNFVMQSTVSRNSAAAARVYAYLSVAQYDAVVRAEDDVGGNESEPEPAPVNGLGSGGRSPPPNDPRGGARAAPPAPTHFDPAPPPPFSGKGQEQANAGPGQLHPDFARGEAVGRQVGAEAIARAITDGFDQPWTGTVPVGPGLWFSSAKPPQPPVNAQLPGMRPFFLRSADQFRPAPPSAFGSPAYLAALAEVRNISAVPSAPSCFSGAAGETVSAFLPAKTDSLNAMVTEAGLARIYGGIHYRFDVDVGQQLGRQVARFVGEVDRSRGSVVAVR